MNSFDRLNQDLEAWREELRKTVETLRTMNKEDGEDSSGGGASDSSRKRKFNNIPGWVVFVPGGD